MKTDMPVYQKYIRIDITPEMQKIVKLRTERRTAIIVRQLVLRNSPYLSKYTTRIIFIAIPIPNDDKDDKKPKILHQRIIDHIQQAVISGSVNKNIFDDMKPAGIRPKIRSPVNETNTTHRILFFIIRK